MECASCSLTFPSVFIASNIIEEFLLLLLCKCALLGAFIQISVVNSDEEIKRLERLQKSLEDRYGENYEDLLAR